MQRVLVPPMAIRRQRQDTDDPSQPVVGAATVKERAMAAIVLDHEQADQEAGRRHRQQQGQPVADAQAEPHRQPQYHKRDRGDAKLHQGPAIPGVTIGRKLG